VKDKNVILNRKTIEAMNAMLYDYSSQTGDTTVNIVSGFRDQNRQSELFNEKKDAAGEVEASEIKFQHEYSENIRNIHIK
jgi:hypothetical protein